MAQPDASVPMNAGDALEAAASASREIDRARQSGRRDLEAFEEENRRLHSELQALRTSRGRRAWLRLRNALRMAAAAILRPFDLVVAIAYRAGGQLGLVAALQLWEQVRARATPLRSFPFHTRESNQDDPTQAVRWLGPMRITGATWYALFCHPESSASFRVPAAPGARLVASCALMPKVWAQNVGGVEFTLTASGTSGGWERTASLVLDPSRRARDRRWRALTIDLPSGAAGEAAITISTRVPQGAAPDHAWALFGEPRVCSPRPFADVWTLGLAEIRRVGLVGAIRRVGQLRARDESAAQYRQWLAAHTPDKAAFAEMAAQAAALPTRPLISIITPVYNTDPKWLRACVESVRAQIYPHWELCLADDASDSRETATVLREYEADPRIRSTRLARNSHISAASNAALDTATGEFVAMLDHDDELPPEALFEVVKHLNAHPDADMIYSDEDKLDLAGERCDPHFKPDWSPELFHSFMYTCHLMVVRRSLVDRVGRFRVGYEGAQDYDLALRVTRCTSRIHHIPKLLYRWRKIPGSAAAEVKAKPWALDAARRALADDVAERRLDAEVLPGEAPGLFRVRFKIQDQPLVTIVVPTDDRSRSLDGRLVPLLPNCLRSVTQKTAYPNYEVLVVDNGRLSEATESFLRTVPHRRVSYHYEGAFNFARKLNFSVRHAKGSHLVVFNDDIEVISSEWLGAMLEHSQRAEIGAVGAKLLFHDGRLQHIGMLIGVCGVAAHAFHTDPGWSAGYSGSAMVVRNYSAVTGACMMTRRSVFDEVGGFNERLAIDFNDVDYCLRVRNAGYRIVYTPYAQLFHLESGTMGPRTQSGSELEEMRRTWGASLEYDPYYNPNLTRDFPDYRLPL